MPQRPRPKLQGAVDPADDAARREVVGHPLDQDVLVQILERQIVLLGQPQEVRGVGQGTPVGVVGRVAVRIAEVDAVGVERRAQGAAGVAGGRRHEHALEPGLRQDSGVGDAVQGHPAAETEVWKPGLLVQRRGQVDQHLFQHLLNAGRAIGEPASFVGLQVDRLVPVPRRPEELDEARGVGALAGGLVLEVLQVQGERPVRRPVDDLAHLVDHGRPPVGGQAHHLVLALVHGEAQIGGEGRVEHPQRVGEPDLPGQGDVGGPAGRARAVADRKRRPFPHAIACQDRRTARRRGEEGGSRVRLVVLGEQDLPPRNAQVGRDHAANPDLLAQRVLHRLGERTPRFGEGPKGAGQDAVELQHRALVEHHGVQRLGLQPRRVEAPFDRFQREGRIVLPARKPLFLDRGDRNAVDHQGRRRVMVVGRNPEDIHVSTGASVHRIARERRATIPPARAPSSAWPAWRRAGR